MIRVGIDIDGCISEYPKLFSILTQSFRSSNEIEVFIISGRENSEESKKATEEELRDLQIEYDHLIISNNKQKVVKANGINLLVDNEDESFQRISKEVCCLKLREEGNYCYDSFRWIGSKRTVKQI